MAFKQVTCAAGAPAPRDGVRVDDGNPKQAFWVILEQLKAAKTAFGLKDRHFGLLQALISFVKERESSGAWVVFASNEKLCQRANEMGERTMRRHIARLVDCGLLRRASSPNGKRYVHRARGGEVVQAYGFDLSPLLERAREIALRAAEAEEEAARVRLLRDRLSVLRRNWPIGSEEDDQIRLALRRRLSSEELEQLIAALSPAPSQAEAEAISVCAVSAEAGENRPITADLSAADGQSVRHHQRSIQNNIDSDSEEGAVKAKTAPVPEPDLKLETVVRACPDAVGFAQTPVRTWTDLHALAHFVAPMLGLRGEVLQSAGKDLGEGGLSLTILAMTQMHGTIRSPGAYLRGLARKAAIGRFRPARLIESLAQNAAPA
ncbi:plasmid replication protein RepC [Cribrihabitans neustonicus]|uniref:plasmid replication protein RepC n=1 Tax=Cribrihabitans neustonicus TaxID=1429085 RepID=UPI003B5BF983